MFSISFSKMKIAFYCLRGKAGSGGLSRAADDLQRELIVAGMDVSALEPGDDLPPCDIIHFHGVWQPAYWKVVEGAKTPYVVSPHGMLEPWAFRHKAWKKWPYFQLVERRFLRQASLLFATGEMEADHLSRLLPGHPLRMIPLGMTGSQAPAYAEARQKLGWDPGTKILLYLSRIHPKKGLDLLLHALRGMPGLQCDTTRLVIVGGGESSYLAPLKKFVKCHAGELPAIEWKGEIWGDEKWLYLQGADIFCLPTHSENFGLAVLDAAQVGTPVLTTDQTPWVEYQGKEGFYISCPEILSVCEQLQAWRGAAVWTLSDREALSAQVKARFDWKFLVREYISVYRTILGESVS
jgi:glycosyltransferase involved in cell wall biosynthesis